MRLKLLIAAGVAAAVVPLAPAPAPAATGSVPCLGGTVTWTPTSLWPPNHRLRPVSIAFTDRNPPHVPISITVDGISSNQGTNRFEPDFAGVGNTASASAPGTARTSVRLRSERDGGTTRVYTITVTCRVGSAEQTRTLQVVVPQSRQRSR